MTEDEIREIGKRFTFGGWKPSDVVALIAALHHEQQENERLQRLISVHNRQTNELAISLGVEPSFNADDTPNTAIIEKVKLLRSSITIEKKWRKDADAKIAELESENQEQVGTEIELGAQLSIAIQALEDEIFAASGCNAGRDATICKCCESSTRLAKAALTRIKEIAVTEK